MERQRDRETEGQRDTETQRQRDRETARQRDRDGHTDTQSPHEATIVTFSLRLLQSQRQREMPLPTPPATRVLSRAVSFPCSLLSSPPRLLQYLEVKLVEFRLHGLPLALALYARTGVAATARQERRRQFRVTMHARVRTTHTTGTGRQLS